LTRTGLLLELEKIGLVLNIFKISELGFRLEERELGLGLDTIGLEKLKYATGTLFLMGVTANSSCLILLP